MNQPTLKLPNILSFEMKDAQTDEHIQRVVLGSYIEQEVAGFKVCITDLKQGTALKYWWKDIVFFTDDKQVDLPLAMERVITNLLCYLPLSEPVPGFIHTLENELPNALTELDLIPTENALFIKVQHQPILSKANLQDAHLD